MTGWSTSEVSAQVEAEIKYAGYIQQQQADIERAARQEHLSAAR